MSCLPIDPGILAIQNAVDRDIREDMMHACVDAVLEFEVLGHDQPMRRERLVKAIAVLVSKDDGELTRLRAALLDIADPMGALQREAEAKGDAFIWKTALLRASDPEYFKGVARKALAG